MKAPDDFPATEKLAEFTASLRSEDLPDEVHAQLGATLIDFFRVAIAGARMPWVTRVSEALFELGGQPQCAVLFNEKRIDAVRAAYLNGVIAGSLEWDDTHVGAMLHPGVVVWPAALAAAQVSGASGREIVPAVVAGYETMIRVGLSVQPTHFRRGFQATATCGVFGAAAAAAKALRLGAEGIRDALGLAASYAGGVAQFYLTGSDVKRVHAGKASASGVEAALRARAGLTGPRDAIEGAQGFARAFADDFDPSLIGEGLGSRYRMLDLTFKPHAGSARLQAAIEAACELVRDGVRANEIASVEIGIPAVIEGRLTLNDPSSLQLAQMSVPFAVAMALTLTRERAWPPTLTVEDFAACVKDENVRSLSRRTQCVRDDIIERAMTPEHVPARVTVTMLDGARREKSILIPTGASRRPISFDELQNRFKAIAMQRVQSADLDAWLQHARTPAKLENAGQLFTLRLAN